MKRFFVFMFALAYVTFVVGCANTEAEKPALGRAKGFQLEDIKGNTVRLSDYKGKIIMLNFFATWCPPCKIEMPDFDAIQKEYEDNVKIIAIAVGNESVSRVRAFAEQNRLDFTIAVDKGEVAGLYGPIRAIPVTVIIDKDFNIAKRYIGLRPKRVFTADIEELL